LISNFCSITGVEAARGQFYLESANWNLQLAIQSFFEHSDDLPINVNPNPNPSEVNTQPIEPFIDHNESDDEMSDKDPDSPKTHKKLTKKDPKHQTSNFATLDSLRRQQDSGQSSEEEGQAFYAGGSERSGQQVLGPSKKKNSDELVSNMFKSAKAHGAEVVDPSDDQKSKKRINTFAGTGFKLGSTSDDSKPVNTMPSTSSQEKNVVTVLKLWKNGFCVDDGPVRAYDDSESQEFLASIHKGEIPRELVQKYKGKEVHLNMEDHRNEDFVPSKPRLEPFTGEGHRLGSPVGDLLTQVVNQGIDSSDPKKCEEEAQTSLNVDQTKPMTSIQIRLSDGSRLVVKLNLSHTIADIRLFICNARPVYYSTPFVLMTTFPNKELSDETLTIKDANLANASIVQRLK